MKIKKIKDKLVTYTPENQFNIAKIFQEFDKRNLIKQIILIGENGKVKNIEIENETI